MNLEGQVRERNLNPKNACLKRRPELQDTLNNYQNDQNPESQEPTVSENSLKPFTIDHKNLQKYFRFLLTNSLVSNLVLAL